MQIEYIHTDSSITTINDFIDQSFSIAIAFSTKKDDFLNYKGDTTKTNKQRIEEMYDGDEKFPLLKPNTKLLIPVDESNRDIISILGKDQILEQRDFNTFLSSHLLRLISDKKYRKTEKYDIQGNLTVQELYPKISVWIYCRAIDKIINITGFLQTLNTNVDGGGGNFSFQIAPIVVLEDSELEVFNHNYVYESNIYKNEGSRERNNFYFHQKISTNDIVFIKFEELEILNEERSKQPFIISKENLPNQIYDMIGLVDSNRININPTSNDVSISISGRDLYKLLIEDSDYFLPVLYSNQAQDFYLNNLQDDKILKRNFVESTYKTLFSYSYRTIRDSVQFTINQCAHLGILPDKKDLFSAYGNRRSKVFRNTTGNPTQKISDFKNTDVQILNDIENIFGKFEQNEEKQGYNFHKGIWQIIKLEIDKSIDDRRIVDHSLSQPDGNLISCISRFCQEPFVEFFGDTYGDMYSFIVRQPPYTRSQIINYLDGIIDIEEPSMLKLGSSAKSKNYIIEIDDSDIISETLEFDDAGAICWYQMDPKELNIMNSNAILSHIPIVFLPEYAEIWGNRRLQIVNNYASYESIRDKGQGINLNLFKKAAVNDFKFILDSTIYLPFSRKGTIIINGDRRIKRGTWIRHKGTNEIFYVNSVGNDFSISDSSIDRTTILSVSRGMIEKYVYGEDIKIKDDTGRIITKNISYFNIVDTELIKNIIIERSLSTSEIRVEAKDTPKTNFGVDKDVFNFFLERKQFD